MLTIANQQDYLQRALLPHLQAGLQHLHKQQQHSCNELIAGAQWDADGHLPRGWRPFSPLSCLAQGLRAANPATQADALLQDAAALERRPYERLGRREKCALLLFHFAKRQLRLVDEAEVRLLLAALQLDGDQQQVAAQLAAVIGPGGAPLLDVHQFADLATALAQQHTDERFEAAMLAALAVWSLEHCSGVQQQLGCVFRHLDLDHSGGLTIPEIAQLARVLQPAATEEQLRASLAFLDTDASHTVAQEEFTGMLGPLVAAMTDPHLLRTKLALMVSSGARPPCALQRLTADIRPRPLTSLARAMVQRNPAVPQCRAADLLALLQQQSEDGSRAPLLVDARPPEEREVSCLPGALPLEVQPDTATATGWRFRHPAQLGAVRAGWQASAGPSQHGDSQQAGGGSGQGSAAHEGAAAEGGAAGVRVVAYCCDGEQSCAAAALLAAELQAPVHALCGGAIGYYNAGGVLVDPASQHPVRCLHPGRPELAAYVCRANWWRPS